MNENSIKEVIQELESSDAIYPKHGVRNAEKKFRSVQKLVDSDLLRDKAKEFLSGSPEIVRVIAFDKTPEKNWLVTWHQDKTVTINKKASIPGWGPWTIKDGIIHVQPEIDVLEDMVTFRIHLDDANESNGCLKVIPKSHRLGILTKQQQDRVIAESKESICPASAGDLLVMRPLLLHSSNKAIAPDHRRILHIEYCSYRLPKGLAWA